MPRPKLSAADKRTETARCRLTVPEREELRDAAARAGLSEAEYLRRRILGHRISAKGSKRADPRKIAALSAAAASLSRVGNNLNQVVHAAHIGRELKGIALALQPEVQAELRKIRDATKALLAEDAD